MLQIVVRVVITSSPPAWTSSAGMLSTPAPDGNEPAGGWATPHDSVHNVLVNKKSNAMLVFILFSNEENLVSFLCCCFAKVLQSHFTESKDIPSVPVHFVC